MEKSLKQYPCQYRYWVAVIRAFENENPFSYALVHSLNTAILQDRVGVGSVWPAESHQCDLPYPHDITQEMESWAQYESPTHPSSLRERETTWSGDR